MRRIRWHDLRHSFASVGAAAGLSLPLIGALLGHRLPSTTQRYAHPGRNAKQDAIARLAKAGYDTPPVTSVVELELPKK